jgi:membrane protein CcdC involved in cytochrome C biogenesis
MRINKNFYLIFAILFSIELMYNSIYDDGNHRVFFMEVNIWVYRLVKLFFIVVFMKSYIDARNREKNRV